MLQLKSFFSSTEHHKCKEQLLCSAASRRPEARSRATAVPPARHPPLDTRQQRAQGQPRSFSPRSAQFPRPLQSRYQWTESQHTGDHVCLCTCQCALMPFTAMLDMATQAGSTGRANRKRENSLVHFTTPFFSPFLPPSPRVPFSHFLEIDTEVSRPS